MTDASVIDRPAADSLTAETPWAPPADLPAFIAVAESRETRVRVLWNDWPIADHDGHGLDHVLLNPFVIEGKNVLRVLVGPVPEPAGHWLRVRLRRCKVGEETTTAPIIHSLQWRPAIGGYSRNDWVEVARHEIFVRKAFGRWGWEDARPFRVEDEPAARDRVMALHAALSRKDLDTFLAMCAPKLEELARSTGRHAGLDTEIQRAMLTDIFSRPHTEVAPLDPDDLEFHSGAGGRLVAVRCRDGNGPLMLRAGTIELRVVLSHLASGFEIVR